jgi:hypothetical protein
MNKTQNTIKINTKMKNDIVSVDLANGYLGVGYSDLSIYFLEHIEIKNLQIFDLVATQERAYRATIDKYKKLILDGKELVYVLAVLWDEKYYIYDGHHRAIAYAELDRLIECEIFSADKTYGDLQNIN